MEKNLPVNIFVSKNARYVGTLKDGLFHGCGKLLFSDGGVYDGLWKEGKHIAGHYIFPDGLPYQENNWKYCSSEDRRFWNEIVSGLTVGESVQETSVQPTPHLPLNHFDTGDGIYDPFENQIYSYDGYFLRIPDEKEKRWILQYCRVGVEREKDTRLYAKECLLDLLDDVSAKLQEIVEFDAADKVIIEGLVQDMTSVVDASHDIMEVCCDRKSDVESTN